MQGLAIETIRRVNEKVTVHDFEVKDAHHYFFEGGVLSHNSMFPSNEAAGGGGFKYACSTILTLSKAKDKEGTDVVGNIITAKTMKSRLSKENAMVKMRLSYDHGLDRYYGLLDLAEEAGIFKKVSTRYELPDGRKVFGKAINDNPEEFFTPDIMQQLEEYAFKKFSYGGGVESSDDNLDDGEYTDVSELSDQ